MLPKIYPLRIVLSFAALLALNLGAQPIDNPVSTHYGAGTYPWADAIEWADTFNILSYGGDNTGTNSNDAAYILARDAAVAAGGGVVYFPSGEYRFDDSIGLADEVVLRGDTPSIADATNPDYRPPSKLVFPKFNFVASGSGTDPSTAFKGIGMVGSGINTGLVHLDVNRASIFAGGYGSSSENVVIFGVRSNNVASKQPWTVPTAEQEDWQIHPYRFAANISAFAYRNVLVANCMLNDAHYWLHREDDGKDMTGAPADLLTMEIDDFEQPGYLIRDDSVWKTHESIAGAPYVFEYTDHYGINVQGSTGEWGAPPWVQPNLFYAGAVIRDNWVYTTMRVKIDASGRGLSVKDNILKDRQGKTRYYDPNGEKRVGNCATLENRGIDWRGHDVLIEGNQIEVFRHLLNGGPYSSVDGEGILHQEVHGTTIDGLVIRNNTANAYIGIWKMPYVRNVVIEGNTLTGAGYIYLQSDTNGSDFPMYKVDVFDNNLGSKGILIRADYYSPGVLSANVYDNLLDGTLEIESHGIHSGNTKLDGTTPATLDTKTGAVAIDPPVEGILYTDGADPDTMASGEATSFTVLVTTPSATVERVNFYRHKTLMATDEVPPYTFDYVSDGSRALWSAKIEQPEQAGGFDPYAALLVEDAPAWAGAPSVTLTDPDPLTTWVAPANLTLEAAVTPGTNAIDRVEFYSGGQYLGADADNLAPYEFTWTGVGLGTYSFTAKVWDSAGAVVISDALGIVVEGVPTSAPLLEATAYSDTEIDLSWSDTALNTDGFRLERSPAGAGTWETVVAPGGSTTSHRDSSLSSNTAYDYRIFATNVHGDSAPSVLASATTYVPAITPPGVPTNFNTSALTESRIRLEWTAATGDIFGYRLESRTDESAAWSPLAEVAGSATSYIHSGLAPAERVFYRLAAWNNTGDSVWTGTSGATLPFNVATTFSAAGDPWPIPGRIEFEDYNPGGYYDSSTGNEGSSNYRFPDSVDLGGTSDITIGWIANGEWLQHSVVVEEAGIYAVVIRYSSPNSNGSLSLKFDGVNIAPPVTFANTGAWGTYQDHTINGVYLDAGHYLMRSFVENSGFNLDYVEFSLTEPASYLNWQAAELSGHPESGAGDNPDHDQYTNQFDFLLGLDPLSHDSTQISVALDAGKGWFRFPIANGLGSVNWAVRYKSALVDPGPWIDIPEENIRILSEESSRRWMEAWITDPGDGALFFHLWMEP